MLPQRLFLYLRNCYQQDIKISADYFFFFLLLAYEVFLFFHLKTSPTPLEYFFHACNVSGVIWLLSRKFSKNQNQIVNAIVWFLLIFYSMPFVTSFILLQGKFSPIYLLLYAIGVLSFLILAGWMRTCCMFLLGIAIVSVGFGDGYFTTIPKDFYFKIIGLFLVLCIIGYFYTKKTKYLRQLSEMQLQDEKLDVLNNLAASLAHELRTPLQTISLGNRNIQKCLPHLVQGYNLAKEAHLKQPVLNETVLKSLDSTLVNIENEIQTSFTFINMLLMNVNRKNIVSAEPEVCLMSECVKEALARYPFTMSERKIVSCDLTNDFEFLGNKLIFVHVLFNLIKNSLYYTSKKKEPSITICLEYGKSKNILHFRDNGEGISKKHRKHIFQKFYSGRQHGTGIGLEFCRVALESFGAHISCFSKEGEYTEFSLFFPTNFAKNPDAKNKWHKLLQNDINVLKSQPGI
ncbi:MAG: ATP-binding protein [Gammaproteobacteria bacterium]